MCTSLSSPSHPLPFTPSPPHRPENTHKGAAAAQQADLNLLYWSSEGGRVCEYGVVLSVEVVWEDVIGVWVEWKEWENTCACFHALSRDGGGGGGGVWKM